MTNINPQDLIHMGTAAFAGLAALVALLVLNHTDSETLQKKPELARVKSRETDLHENR